MTATARKCVEGMAHAGYDVSILFGRPDFYERFGYVRAWPTTEYTISAEDIRRSVAGGTGLSITKFAPGGRAVMDALYNRH